jgi:hypothetical protein
MWANRPTSFDTSPFALDPPEPDAFGHDGNVSGGPNGSNLNHISSNNHSGHTLDSTGSGRNGLNHSMSNLHIHPSPTIASPSIGSTRGGFGGSISGSPSNGGSNSKIIAQNVEDSLNDPQLAGHPSTWSIEQVAYWLRLCGFGSVASSFIGESSFRNNFAHYSCRLHVSNSQQSPQSILALR